MNPEPHKLSLNLLTVIIRKQRLSGIKAKAKDLEKENNDENHSYVYCQGKYGVNQ